MLFRSLKTQILTVDVDGCWWDAPPNIVISPNSIGRVPISFSPKGETFDNNPVEGYITIKASD